MKIEFREDKAIISGYVNAVERYSKPLNVNNKKVLEKIKAGVFTRALKKADNVQVLLNHNKERVLANTNDNTAILSEDNIGLRAEVTVTDKETVEKAKNGKLSGWSFGFYCNADEEGNENGQETRTVTDIDLVEVSILDDTKSPAYTGTSIETREDKQLEFRANTVEEVEELAREQHREIEDLKFELRKREELAEKIVEKLLEKFTITPKEPQHEITRSLEEFEKRLKSLERMTK